jgi:hypothetical protein
MKLLAVLLLSVLFCATAIAASDGGSLAGVYRLTSRDPDRRLEMRLECANETQCTFTTTLESKVQSARDVRQLTVKALVNPVRAEQALDYAMDWLHRPVRDEDLAATIEDLRRWLRPDTEIAKCWDLNYVEPGNMLVCRLKNTAAKPTSLFLFGTLEGPCVEAFCGYVIESPMKRIR